MSSANWELRLSTHFAELARTRSESGRPVFGLEHGLSLEEVKALRRSIVEDLQRTKAIANMPLSWVVHASEAGYQFSGGEFWRTFESLTPGWLEWGHRAWIRACFTQFCEQYSGAQPRGPWARHRSIMCWPITHAILPADLQRQLAKVLFGLSYDVGDSDFESPDGLGGLIAAHSWHTSSRFKQLVQEPALIGQLAVALLAPESVANNALILGSTLNRICDDLDREQRARFWLGSAKTQAHRRAMLRGLQRAGTQRGDTRSSPIGAEPMRPDRLSPRLMLRAMDSNSWSVYAEFPNVSTWLTRFPETIQALTESRITVVGSSVAPMAPRSLLYQPRPVRLIDWASPATPLLKFEKSTEVLDRLLLTDCVLGSGPWLFKKNGTGSAVHLLTGIVRRNSQYLLLSTIDTPIAIPGALEVGVECEGVAGVEFDVGDTLSDDLLVALEHHRVQPAREIRLSPAGATPARWDGEGSIEWLSTDDSTVCVETNYAVRRYEFELTADNHCISRVGLDAGGNRKSFLRLPQLDAGQYLLHVSAEAELGNRTEHGHADIVVRNPIRSGDQAASGGALLLTVYPPGPTLEELWGGNASLELIGPKSRRVECTLKLFDRRHLASLFEEQFTVSLPVSSHAWREIVDKRWQSNERCMFAYGAANTCEITFAGGELGSQQVICERALTPLRWAFRQHATGYEVRLIDDTEEPHPHFVSHFTFEQPDRSEQLSARDFTNKAVHAKPGLYVAVGENQESGLVVPPQITELRQLRLTPHLQRHPPSAQAALSLIELLEHWSSAQVANTLVAGRFRNSVVEVCLRDLFRVLGGHAWFRAERVPQNRGGEDWLAKMADAIPSRMFGRGWAATILGRIVELALMSTTGRVEFLATITGQSRDLCEFALRLSSAPAGARPFAGEQAQSMIKEMRLKTTVSRISRFFCLVVTDHLNVQPISGANPYVGWEWN